MVSVIAIPFVFVLLILAPNEIEPARLMIDSIRAYGGALSDSPIIVFEADEKKASCSSLAGKNVEIIRLTIPDKMKNYYFGEKVYACAEAEKMVGNSVQSLVWLNNCVLFVNPPTELVLDSKHDVAIRPVLVQNVGNPVDQPLDAFWQRIYQQVGLDDTDIVVESFVDRKQIRAYFTTYAFSVNPTRGIFTKWLKCFEELIDDKAFQESECKDNLHKIFLHQAVLSAVISKELGKERIRILTDDYNYAYNLQKDIPQERRAKLLNDLTCVVCEDRTMNPVEVTDIEIREPLRAFLLKHYEAKK